MNGLPTAFLYTFGGYVVAMLGAFLLARAVTGWSRLLAMRRGVMSLVDHRSSHTVPTPRLGGLGLAAGFAFPSLAFLILLWLIPHRGAAVGFHVLPMLWLALGWLLMFAVGLLDDVLTLPPLGKLALMAGAVLAPICGGDIGFIFAHGFFLSTAVWSFILLLMSMGWILFFTNGYNFMDGMDGLAAGFARIAALAIFGAAFLPGLLGGNVNLLRAEVYLLPILAMACWGFLHWNRPPALVFMGDGGSLSTGYLLSVWVIMGHRGMFGITVPLALSLTILMPFLFDISLTLVRRLRRGENLLQAHREHLYQRLLRTGLTHAQVLHMNLRRFGICAGLALLAASLPGVLNSGVMRGLVGAGPILFLDRPFVRPGLNLAALGLSLLVMLQYWHQAANREARPARNEISGNCNGA